MSCFKPTTIRIKNEYREYDQKINCRNCIGCLTGHAQMWTDRIMNEASMHHLSLFVTLSYDPDHLPENESLNIEDNQLFMKRLRSHYKGKKIRFLYKGEYGENTLRAHMHYALFGAPVNDLEFHHKTQQGHKLYTSATLEKIWGKGIVMIGELNQTTAGYIARYIVKQEKSKSKKFDYSLIDNDGVIHLRKKPFLNMSRNPGIGRGWLEKNIKDVFPCDEIIDGVVPLIGATGEPSRIRGNVKISKHKPCDYYLRVLEQIDPGMHESVKAKREDETLNPKVKQNRTKARLKVREICKIAKLTLKGRDLKETNEDV